MPHYNEPAPALLGFDLHIIRACNQRSGCGYQLNAPGPQSCTHANLSILSLFGQRPAYNMCRNLEWISCTVQGKLFKQKNAELIFTLPPHMLSIAELWAVAHSKVGTYSTKSVYLLETCLLAKFCKNADELFRVQGMTPFVCDFDPDMLRKFVLSMLSPARRADPMRPD
ncbi:hypothetical protein T492DRAFT_77317 [Pavlovales sp. CCMP2436]|nr:hypothetical protein T492DRAFT_77317 [Pavlovales sp. CCMP2436]